jgi:two-component system cell cycle response regulator CtrA
MNPEWTNTRDSLHKEIADLRQQVLERDIRIEQLNSLLTGEPVDFWRVWHLTGQETHLMRALMSGRLCSKEYLLDFLYSQCKREPQVKIIDVFICKMRNKLTPSGIYIETVWGRGYRMSAETIARVKTSSPRDQARRVNINIEIQPSGYFAVTPGSVGLSDEEVAQVERGLLPQPRVETMLAIIRGAMFYLSTVQAQGHA